MAKIRGSKEGFANDPSMSMPTEQKTSESNRQKIAKIHDMFVITTKDNIAKILQYYDDDENKVIDAITRDGGKEALSNWADSGSFKSRNTKKNKKKKRGKKDSGLAMSTTASFDADDSSSIHSGCNADIEAEKDSQTTENGNGNVLEIVDKRGNLGNILSNHEHLNNNEAENVSNEPEKEIAPHKLAFASAQTINAPVYEEIAHRASVSSESNRNVAENVSRVSPLSDNSEKQEEPGIKRDKYRSINDNYSRHSPRQRTSSFRRNKSSSMSEDSSSQHNPQAAAVPTKRGYERCKKDLHRQTASLQRINSQLEKGFEDSEKRLKNAFADILKQIENRQKELELELAKRKTEAFNLLKSRQDLGVELKRKVDRTSSLSEAEWSELRSDIKQFVTERKYDDDLGKTIWFQWPDISETIKTFGEVHPVKNVYSQRSHSAHDNATASNNPEPSPSSSLANEEIESSADKNDVANIADAVEDETATVEKEETPVFNKNQQPTENRGTRIYQNKNYGRFNAGRFPNSNQRFFRGRGTGGFQRPYPRNNYQYNRQPHYEDYNKNHPHPERDIRINEGAAYPGERNPNPPRDYKNNRSRGRGPYSNNYRFENRYRGGPRHNAEHSEPQPPLNAAAVANSNIEKSNAVNGYVNNNN